MSERDKKRLDGKLDALSGKLPSPMVRFLDWLRSPSSKFVRLPAGVLLILLGFVGFLPVLGFWMVPLGIILLALDIPFLRRPTLSALLWFERKWKKWRR